MATVAMQSCKLLSSLLRNSSKCVCSVAKIRNYSPMSNNLKKPPVFSSIYLVNCSEYFSNRSWTVTYRSNIFMISLFSM